MSVSLSGRTSKLMFVEGATRLQTLYGNIFLRSYAELTAAPMTIKSALQELGMLRLPIKEVH